MTRSHLCFSAQPLIIGLILGIASCIAADAQWSLEKDYLRPEGLNFAPPGMPFQAEGSAQTTQKLSDSNTLVHEIHFTWARDQDGRFFCKTQPSKPADGIESYIIVDPVARLKFSWNTRSKVVTSEQLGASNHLTISPLPLTPDAYTPMPADKKQVTTEDLDKRSIAGVEGDGKRIVSTITAGAIGNATPIVIIHQVWSSAEFQLVLADSEENTLGGNRKSEITSLTKGSPPQELFQPPQGMTIRDLTAPLGFPPIPPSR
jgi:hypothetical protein